MLYISWKIELQSLMCIIQEVTIFAITAPFVNLNLSNQAINA